ncbi:hypothetical protein DMUE_2241 [Dictyocoela muelleri]|nr:hypothetical protein DMUE_2241 [Dictyocoela muelleri]
MNKNDIEKYCLQAIRENNTDLFNQCFNYIIYYKIKNPLIKAYKLISLLLEKNFTDYYCLIEKLGNEEFNTNEINIVIAVERNVRTNNILGIENLARSVQGELNPIIKSVLNKLLNSNNQKSVAIIDKDNYLKEVVNDCLEIYKLRSL